MYVKNHYNVIKWKHFPRHGPFVKGIHRSPVNSPKDQWHGALMFSLICAWINGWVNNGKAGDLRRHRAHYDATVMITFRNIFCSLRWMPENIINEKSTLVQVMDWCRQTTPHYPSQHIMGFPRSTSLSKYILPYRFTEKIASYISNETFYRCMKVIFSLV